MDRILRSFWIGLHRVTGSIANHSSIDNNVYSLWSDRTENDYGSYPNNSVNPNTEAYPWVRGTPNGVNTSMF
jgi:hypothetical protein